MSATTHPAPNAIGRGIPPALASRGISAVSYTCIVARALPRLGASFSATWLTGPRRVSVGCSPASREPKECRRTSIRFLACLLKQPSAPRTPADSRPGGFTGCSLGPIL